MNYFRRSLIDLAVPVTKAVGKMHAPFSHHTIKATNVRDIQRFAKPGDVIFSRTRGEVSNLFIPGRYTHGVIFLDYNHIMEAIGKGVTETNIYDFCLTKDELCLARYMPELSDSLRESVIAEVYNCEGKAYDYRFGGSGDQFYCVELIYYVYSYVLGSNFLMKKKDDEILTPELFLKDKCWKTIYETNGKTVVYL